MRSLGGLALPLPSPGSQDNAVETQKLELARALRKYLVLANLSRMRTCKATRWRSWSSKPAWLFFPRQKIMPKSLKQSHFQPLFDRNPKRTF
jgi:hypothetical protein